MVVQKKSIGTTLTRRYVTWPLEGVLCSQDGVADVLYRPLSDDLKGLIDVGAFLGAGFNVGNAAVGPAPCKDLFLLYLSSQGVRRGLLLGLISTYAKGSSGLVHGRCLITLVANEDKEDGNRLVRVP